MDIGQTPHELGAQGPSQVQQDVALHSFGRYIFLKQFLAVAVIKKKKNQNSKMVPLREIGQTIQGLFSACESIIISVKFQFEKRKHVLHRSQYGMSGESNLTKI